MFIELIFKKYVFLPFPNSHNQHLQVVCSQLTNLIQHEKSNYFRLEGHYYNKAQ
jgi:hypothetical protein